MLDRANLKDTKYPEHQNDKAYEDTRDEMLKDNKKI